LLPYGVSIQNIGIRRRGFLKTSIHSSVTFYSTYQDYLERFRRVIIEYYQEQKSIGIIPDLSFYQKTPGRRNSKEKEGS
jgi:hypothetical protein